MARNSSYYTSVAGWLRHSLPFSVRDNLDIIGCSGDETIMCLASSTRLLAISSLLCLILGWGTKHELLLVSCALPLALGDAFGAALLFIYLGLGTIVEAL